jgi:hypothetical protein
LSFKGSSSSCSVRARRTVREELDSPSVRRVLRVFVRVVRSICLVGWFLVHEVRGRSVLECRTVRDEADGPQVHLGRSVFLGALLEVRAAFSYGPPPNRGRSALHLADCLSLSLLELHFRFDLSWGLLLWKVHCDYVTLASSCGNPWL